MSFFFSLSWVSAPAWLTRTVRGVRRMTGHLSPASLNSFVDGELSTEQPVTATNILRMSVLCRGSPAAFREYRRYSMHLQRTAIASGKPDAPVTGVCDHARLAGASAADSELAARLSLGLIPCDIRVV